MISINDITEIRKALNHQKGYEIVFNNGKEIWIVKRRTIPGLLLLIKHGICSEADLAGANNRLKELKDDLKGKIDPSWIQDRYGDANKPFSELWTEEGFSCIRAEGIKGNRQYVLYSNDHEMLFNDTLKGDRTVISKPVRTKILLRQNGKCNICGAKLKENSDIAPHTFEKDRVRLEIDHRIPVDHGGTSTLSNLQALCHYCNKSKRHMS